MVCLLTGGVTGELSGAEIFDPPGEQAACQAEPADALRPEAPQDLDILEIPEA
jgi:hypothetical protein